MPAPHHDDKCVTSVSVAVITVSDTRTPETDIAGKLIRDRLTDNNHRILSHDIIPDEPDQVRARAKALCDEKCQAILITGGTGVTARDTTCEALAPLLQKPLEGFGELFRILSFEEIGPAAMLSRAMAGVCQRTVIFALPGSTAAVRLALDRLILPELGHLAWLLAPPTSADGQG